MKHRVPADASQCGAGPQFEQQQRHAATEVARFLDLVSGHIAEVIEAVGAGDGFAQSLPLERSDVPGVRDRHLRKAEEALHAALIQGVEGVVLELMAESDNPQEGTVTAKHPPQQIGRVRLSPGEEHAALALAERRGQRGGFEPLGGVVDGRRPAGRRQLENPRVLPR